MAARRLLDELRAAGLTLSVTANGALQVTPKSNLTPELRAQISGHKAELLRQLALAGVEEKTPRPAIPTDNTQAATGATQQPTEDTSPVEPRAANARFTADAAHGATGQIDDAQLPGSARLRHHADGERQGALREREARLRQLDAEGWRLNDERAPLATELADVETRIANGEKAIDQRREQGQRVPGDWKALLLQLRHRRTVLQDKIARLDEQIAVVSDEFTRLLGEYEQMLEGQAA